MTENQNIVAINSQYIKDMSLEVPNAPAIFEKITTQPEIAVELNIDAKKVNEDKLPFATKGTKLNISYKKGEGIIEIIKIN